MLEARQHVSLRDGQPQSLPATRPVPVYRVHHEGDEVVVTDDSLESSEADQ